MKTDSSGMISNPGKLHAEVLRILEAFTSEYSFVFGCDVISVVAYQTFYDVTASDTRIWSYWDLQ